MNEYKPVVHQHQIYNKRAKLSELEKAHLMRRKCHLVSKIVYHTAGNSQSYYSISFMTTYFGHKMALHAKTFYTDYMALTQHVVQPSI